MADLTTPTSVPQAPSGGRDEPKLGDELPDELVPGAARGKYSVPDNARRRRPALVFLVVAAACLALWLTRADGGVLVNDGIGWAALGFALLSFYFLASARSVKLWEPEAIAIAMEITELHDGSGRAQLAWRGLAGRPVWRVLVYGAGDPPVRRGVVIVDARSGKAIEHLTEAVPDDSAEVAAE